MVKYQPSAEASRTGRVQNDLTVLEKVSRERLIALVAAEQTRSLALETVSHRLQQHQAVLNTDEQHREEVVVARDRQEHRDLCHDHTRFSRCLNDPRTCDVPFDNQFSRTGQHRESGFTLRKPKVALCNRDNTYINKDDGFKNERLFNGVLKFHRISCYGQVKPFIYIRSARKP
ncbi:hypothetical protein M513_04399 [Trichuris suis]|uniref:Uncharacterized protein n=1 Tax=Trichuris suis TaxID=68888 RepID=A0A085MBV3_9BILA|nr:hypothetical protein M513_04399 [Trichuris suis]